MDDRLKGIKRALDNTCQWLYSTPEYTAWMQRQNVHENLGLLWIMGKPGSGKSTLMKDALRNTPNMLSHSGTATIGFFFNARGAHELEKTPLGLYQSLLQQVLLQDTLAVQHLAPEYARRIERNPEFKWHEEDLQDLLERVLATRFSKPAFLFIDALDECDKNKVWDLIEFFKNLAKKALKVGACLNICLSSRHFPNISIERCPKVVVEDNNRKDILRYIENKAEDNRSIANLKADIFNRSSGTFLWVVLTVALLQKHGGGKSLKKLQDELREIPDELEDLFQTLLRQDDGRDAETVRSQTACLMQLILFAFEPMTLSQIHVVLGFGRVAYGSINALRDSAEYIEAETARKEVVIRLSRGLLEEYPNSAFTPAVDNFRNDNIRSLDTEGINGSDTSDDHEKYKTESTYQFIHETVREYFLHGKGFDLLDVSPPNLAGAGHLMLATCGLNFLAIDECSFNSFRFWAENRGYAAPKELALLDYMSLHLFDHVEAAAKSGMPQELALPLIHRLSARSCEPLRRLLDLRVQRQSSRFQEGSTILIAAVHFGALETARQILGMGFDVNERSATLGTYALHEALRGPFTKLRIHYGIREAPQPKMVYLLLSHGADVRLKDGSGRTPLHIAALTTIELVEAVLAKDPIVDEEDNQGFAPVDLALSTFRMYSPRQRIISTLIEHGAQGKQARDRVLDFKRQPLDSTNTTDFKDALVSVLRQRRDRRSRRDQGRQLPGKSVASW